MHVYANHYHTDIKMPPIIRKQGRPKGHEVTVIGLPAKKKTKKNPTVTRLQPFIELHTSIKEKGMKSLIIMFLVFSSNFPRMYSNAEMVC